jgi:hypothetical protein
MPVFLFDISADMIQSFQNGITNGQYNNNTNAPITLTNPRTGVAYTDVGSAMAGQFQQAVFSNYLNLYSQNNNINAAQASVKAAQNNLAQAINYIPPFGVEFQIIPQTATIAHNASGNVTVGMNIVDPSYTGNISLSFLGAAPSTGSNNNASGITVTGITPSSLNAAGNFTATVAVSNTTVAGQYVLTFIGSDGNNVSNSGNNGLTVT